MLDERGIQVDEMTQRLGMKDNEIMDLRASLSGLETTVDMLRFNFVIILKFIPGSYLISTSVKFARHVSGLTVNNVKIS